MGSQPSLAKNTLILYIRITIVTVVGILSSRTKLQAIGEIDYGIFNVVFGIAAMFQIIAGALVVTGNRFFIIDMTNNPKRLNETFNVLYFTHLALAIILGVVIEIVGLYLLNYQLIIPDERMWVAYVIFQLSIVYFVLTIIAIPYRSIIIANELFSVQAYADIFTSVSILLLSLFITCINVDRLLSFSIGMVCIQLAVLLIFYYCCRKKFEYSRFSKKINFSRIKQIFGFASWNFLGTISLSFRMQGTNIMLNTFFGPIVNTSRGIAFQLNSALNSLSSTMGTAIGPRIVKYYDTGNYDGVNKLVIMGAKYAFIIYYIFALPLFISIDYVLNLWLGRMPEYSNYFSKLILIYGLVNTFASTLITLAIASKKVKEFYTIVSVIEFLSVFVTFIMLKISDNPVVVFYLYVIVELILLLAKMYIMKVKTKFYLGEYVKQAFLPCLGLTIITSALTIPFFPTVNSFFDLVKVTLVSSAIVIISSFVIIMRREERERAYSFIRSKLARIRKH